MIVLFANIFLKHDNIETEQNLFIVQSRIIDHTILKVILLISWFI